jgi:signal peptidase I
VRTLAIGAAVVLGAVVLVTAAIGYSGLRHTKRYRVPSASMEPTIKIGARIKVETDAYDHAAPKRGDIVVFHPPAGAETDACGDTDRPAGAACDRPTPGQSKVSFIKRIVAVGGDRLSIRHGIVSLDGRRVSEPYVAGPCRNEVSRICDFPEEIVIPRGYYFVLGDTRDESDDSRFWGPIPASAIVGRVNR